MRVSDYYNLGRTQPYLDFVDIRLDTDIPVFLDPTAIKTLDSPWGHELSSLLQSFFECVLKHIKNGNDSKAQLLLASLNERNEFHLGFSRGESRGHAFGTISAESVWGALSKSQASLTGLLQDLEDTCLLINGIGTDMISDAVSNIIRGPLIKYTQEMCIYYGIPLVDGVESGPIWNPVKETWENAFVALPITDYGKIVLVPKVLVRQRVCYKYDEYYRHFLLPEMQSEELKSHSSLVEVLKNGSERVTKKALMGKYGSDKLAVVTETLKRPHVLDDYRENKKTNAPLPLTHEEISSVEESEKPNWEGLINELEAIPTGRESAGAYEDTIEKIFTSLLYPSLCYPIKQHNIHDGRKRIDITYTNEARNGFFAWLSLHYPSSMIFIECKNYGKEVSNPEVDQLSGRFSPSRGKVGILTCRQIEDKERLKKRCKDTANDSRGFIISLDDQDIIDLIKCRQSEPESNEYKLLRNMFNELIS
ncbi:hypothetical protein K6Y31_21880 [Motilimonas cestriensis]|jgi:hypothetical protein|uniref:Restriction endonuclease type IV Mrr domain-containing protein n=1 Tax=Motilimonas cestriensis TaxID=2742685 RepID=A0ABS8WGL0_9GAMM|nr:hypothetical protein [Motilimonas cestriensis]MCE2597420.1 hypothetical protein [Motilimonas cestriensis]